MSQASQPLLPDEASDPATNEQRLIELSANLNLQFLIAGNPSTPESQLEILAQNKDVQVRQAVASNPNTSWPTLQYLAWEFPHEFLHNPAGQHQLMVDPEQICTDDAFWDVLLRVAPIPSWWWDWLTNHPTLSSSEMVHLHIQYTGEAIHPYDVPQQGEENTLLTLVKLLTAASAQGVALPAPPATALTGQAVITGEQWMRERLQWLAQHLDTKVRQEVACNPQTPIETLRALALDYANEVRWEVAGNKQTPVDALRILAMDQNHEVRSSVAGNKQTPVDVLRVLAMDQAKDVREEVAGNAQTPAEILFSLALDQNDRVRQAVASHPQTPVRMLRSLSLDQDDDEVRWFVAMNAQTPVEILHDLAQDESEWVRGSVAYHPQTPVEDLRDLAQHLAVHVRRNVAQNARTPADVLRVLAMDQEDYEVRRNVAENTRTPEDVLRVLAMDAKADMRGAVACNPQTPEDVLRDLAMDQEAQVRAAIAIHLQMPEEILRMLAQDANTDVRRTANFIQNLLAQNENLLESLEWGKQFRKVALMRKELVEKQLDWVNGLNVAPKVRQTIIAAFAADWDAKIDQIPFSRAEEWERLIAPFMPPLALRKLASFPAWEIRYLVALHDQTPGETRQVLSQDSNRYVRAMARAKAKMMRERTQGES